jgi:branched-chain amino acid transport system substrate-binding protein
MFFSNQPHGDDSMLDCQGLIARDADCPPAIAPFRRKGLLWSAVLIGLLVAVPARADKPGAKIGVLNDQSGPYAAHTGPGSVDAARMAIEDFGGKVLGGAIELITGDHQNKPDVGLNLARSWLDAQGVDVIVDVPASSVALAIQNLARERRKIVIYSGAGTSELTGKACSPYGIHWTHDTYAITKAPVHAAMQSGLKSWYFLTVDFAFGHAVQRDAIAAVEAAGGKVLGAVRHPFNMADFAAPLLTAKHAGAEIIGLANAGSDTTIALKQAREFGLPTEKQKLVALMLTLTDVHALGLPVAQGALLTEAFYWDLNEASRVWSQRFLTRNGKMPNMIHAGVYGAVTHYLKAVASAGTTNSDAVREAMGRLPINDMMTTDGRIREDGRVLRDFHVFEVKTPAASQRPWDYYKLVRTVPAAESAVPLSESQCDLAQMKRG